MAVLIHVDFPHKDVWGKEMAGGVYMFDSRENAEKYLKMHSERLAQFGYSNIRGKVFEINEELSAICKAPLQ